VISQLHDPGERIAAILSERTTTSKEQKMGHPHKKHNIKQNKSTIGEHYCRHYCCVLWDGRTAVKHGDRPRTSHTDKGRLKSQSSWNWWSDINHKIISNLNFCKVSSACWVREMLAKEHKQKNGCFTWKSLPLSRWSYQTLSGKRSEDQNAFRKTVVQYLISLGKEHHCEKMFQLTKRCDKCLNANSDYVEK
jgi:hypothetical protein